jgi:hypothetical protein
MEKLPGPNHVETLEARYWWLHALRIGGQHERVVAMADELESRYRAAGMKATSLARVLFLKGTNLNSLGRHAAGEPALREALAIYLKETPQAWNTANCKFHLGAALANQQKSAEAEQLLLAAFNDMTERLAQTPPWGQNHRREVAARLVAFYTGQKRTDEVARWEQVRDGLAATAAQQGP